MDKNIYPDIEEELTAAAEPAVGVLSENFSKSGVLRQVMKLSRPDKVALVRCLEKNLEKEEPFLTDGLGRIILTKPMHEALIKAERSQENGDCLSEETFKQRFAEWL